MTGTYWSAHTHSRYSAKDALPEPKDIVARAVELGYPALNLSDHGNMGGGVEHYLACRKAGIKPLIGSEMYVAFDRSIRNISEKGKAGRIQTHHMVLAAHTTQGYLNMVRLNNLAYKNYYFTPVIDFGDFADASAAGLLKGVAITTGCWFGMIPKQLRDGKDPLAALNMIKALMGWFDGNVFVELQNHSILDEDHDDTLHNRLMYDLAVTAGCPMILTQDSHYVEPMHKPVHEYMKQLNSWSDDPDDAVFPGDGYHMVDTRWMRRHHEPDLFAAGMEGLDYLESISNLTIPQLDTFKLVVPDVTGTGKSDEHLKTRVDLGFAAKMESGEVMVKQVTAMSQRLDEEIETITGAGFAGYLLFAAAFADFLREASIRFNIRGSASGSAVCWMLGITSLNPITWKLSKDRFLSSDQTKPPDIDFDIEHSRRSDAVVWLQSNFHVINISTWMKMTVNPEDEEAGSLLVKWKMRARKMGMDAERIPPIEITRLKVLSGFKAYGGYGVHAAGLLVTPDEASAAIVPQMYVASSKTPVTAYDMDSVEKLGLTKLDVLGLKTLSAMHTMEDLTGVGMYDVPLNDASVYSMIGRGKTTGLFQLDGGAARRGCQQLKPRNIHDVIAAMALFRPAALNSGATRDYIDRRHKRASAPMRHDLIAVETTETFGVIVYQEQVLNIMKSIGLTVEEVEKGRKAIKASNEGVADARKTMNEITVRVRALGAERGLSEVDIAWLEQSLHAYANYGFNRAHATAYGILAYVTGWYRLKHPLAYWTGMLQAYTGAKRGKFNVELAYLKEARADDVRILAPHVNVSGAGYTLDLPKNAIRKGLTSIKGVGAVAARELEANAPYDSLDDLARKVAAKRVTGKINLGLGHSPLSCGGTITLLEQAGALKGLVREKTTTEGKTA